MVDYWMEGMAGVGRMCRSGFAAILNSYTAKPRYNEIKEEAI